MLIVLLPGMDGTGRLFGAFLKSLPTDATTKIVTYPDRIYLSYEQLGELVFRQLPTTGRYIIIAESFSGPIALRLANRAPGNLAAVVLVSSFAYQPLSWMGFNLGLPTIEPYSSRATSRLHSENILTWQISINR